MVYVCELENGESLSDELERSIKDLTNFQEENEKRSFEDLVDCQEGRTKISGCQVGKEERRLSQSIKNLDESSYQQGVLMEEENDHR
jgi:hypothetical protein